MSRIVCAFVCLCASLVAAEDKPEVKNLLKPINKVESWRFEEHEGGKGSLKADGETIVFNATTLTGTDWHVQVYQVDLDLKEGQAYVLKFEAKSPERRGANVIAGIDQEDWHEIGLHEEIFAAPVEFKEYSYTFTASDVAPKKNRLGFVLGNEKGTLIIKNMTLTEKK